MLSFEEFKKLKEQNGGVAPTSQRKQGGEKKSGGSTGVMTFEEWKEHKKQQAQQAQPPAPRQSNAQIAANARKSLQTHQVENQQKWDKWQRDYEEALAAVEAALNPAEPEQGTAAAPAQAERAEAAAIGMQPMRDLLQNNGIGYRTKAMEQTERYIAEKQEQEQLETLLNEAQANLDAYLESEEHRSIALQNMAAKGTALRQGAMVSSYPAAAQDTTQQTDEKEAQLRAIRDYYKNLYDAQVSQQIMDAGLAELETWTDEDRINLQWYINARNTAQTNNMFYGPQFDAYNLNPIVQKYGIGKVRQMAEILERKQNEEAAKRVKEASRAAVTGGFWNGAGHSAASVGANLIGSMMAVPGRVLELQNHTGQFPTLQEHTLYDLPALYAGTVRGKISENITGDQYDEYGNLISDGGAVRQGLATLYGAGMSAADNAARLLLSFGNGAVSLGLAATGSFGQTVSQMSAQGANPAQAVAMGIVTGGLEVITEKVSLDNLFKQAAAGPKNMWAAIGGALKAGGIEVSEEELNFLCSTIAEAGIMRGKSAYNRQVQQLMMEQGKSYEEAVAIADATLLAEAANTAVQSFLSGNIMGGGAQIAGAYKTAKLGKNLEKYLDEAGVQSLIDDALKNGDKKLQRQIESGKMPSSYQLARMYQEKVAAEDAEGKKTAAVADERAEENPAKEPEKVRISDSGTAMLASPVGVENTREQLAEAKRVAAEYGVDINLYTEYDTERESYVEDGEIYINTESKTPFEAIVQGYIHEQEQSAQTQTEPVAPAVIQNEQNVIEEAPNVTRQEENVTAAPVSVAAQIRQNQNLNGGNIYETDTADSAAADAGAGVLHGGSQRYDGARAGEQAGSMAGRAGQTAQGNRTATDRFGTQRNRKNLRQNLRLEWVSPKSLGIQSGDESKSLRVVPETDWDNRMREKAEQLRQEIGEDVKITYVLGPIKVRIGGRVQHVKGVRSENGIIVRADHSAYTPEQIADHESYHEIVERHTRGWAVKELLTDRISEVFSREELYEVLEKYKMALREIHYSEGVENVEEEHELSDLALEELLADAYAGINAFGAKADRFTDTVRQTMQDNYILGWSNQENGVRETNGPPTTERYSYEGDNAEVEDSQTLGEEEQASSYEGRSLTEDSSIYSYDFLTNQRDMTVTMLPEVNEVRDTDGKINAADIVSEGMKNARAVGTERAGNIYVTNRYTGRELWVTAASVRHGLNGAMNRKLTNARLGSVIGEVVQNAIPINALHDTAEGVVGTYAMAGYAADSQGREFVAIITVEQRGNSVSGIDVFDVTHAVSGRQKNGSNRNNPAASNGGSQANTKFQGVNLIKTSSKISIRDLLGIVKDTYQSILSGDVLNHLGEERNPQGHYYGRVRYSVDDDAEAAETEVLPNFEKVRAELKGTRKDREEQFLRNELGDEGYEQYQQWERAQREQQKKQRDQLKKENKGNSKPTEAKRELRGSVMDLFSVPAGERAELGRVIDNFADRLIRREKITEDDRRAFFDRMYEAGVMTVSADDYFQQGRKLIMDGKVYVPESVRADFGEDWNEFRARAFGAGITITYDKDAAQGIDSWNHELASELPGLFDESETDMRAILERIVDVAEEGRDEKMSLAEYTAMLAERGDISEDEFLDDMERKLDEALRTFAKQAHLEVRLKDRSKYQIEKERQVHKQMQERQRERKQLREMQQRTLKTLQWLKKNRRRAPEELEKAIDEVLGDLDLYAVHAAKASNWSEKYNATWEDIVAVYDKAKAEDPNFFETAELDRFATRLRGAKLENLSVDALDDLYKLAVGIQTTMQNRDKVLRDERDRHFREVFEDSRDEIKGSGGKPTLNIIRQLFNEAQLTPMNVFQRMVGWNPDSEFFSMMKQLEKGERDMRAHQVKAQRILENFMNEHKDYVKRADGQGEDGIWYKVEVPRLVALELGKPPKFDGTVGVWMTSAQKVHLYLESRHQDNLRHMVGGRTFVNKELYQKGDRRQAFTNGTTVRMAPETVKLLVQNMTDEEMELAKLLDQYYNIMAPEEINAVSNVLYGYDKAMGGHYAPIYTNNNYTESEFGVFNTTAEGVPNLKERQKFSKNPSYNISCFEAFEKSVEYTARFVGMAIPIRNVQNLMNVKTKNDSMKQVISETWRNDAIKYIEDICNALQGNAPAQKEKGTVGAWFDRAVEKLQSNYISSTFGFNPSIVCKQLGSIPMASAYLDWKNIPKPNQWKGIDKKLIARYTQDLAWRTMGYSMPETKLLKDNPNWTQTNKVFRFWFGGDAITAVDGWAASVLWPWAENKVQRDFPDLEIGTKEQIEKGESPFYRKVAELFDDALARSQSTSDEIHQSSMRKSTGMIARALTMFRSDSAQTYNALRQKIGEARYFAAREKQLDERLSEGNKETAEQLVATLKETKDSRMAAQTAAGNAVMAMVLNAMWSEVVTFGWALLRNKHKRYKDDENELTFASVAEEMVSGMIGSMAGIVTGGEELSSAIGSMLTGEQWYGIESLGLEQVNALIDAIRDSGSGFGRIITGWIDVLQADGDGGQYWKENLNALLGEIKRMAETVAVYSSYPVTNVEAVLLGAFKWISPELGAAYDDLWQSIDKSDLTGLTGGALEGRVKRILRTRSISKDKETAKVLAGLYEAGHKGAIPSKIPSSVTIDGESQELDAALQNQYSEAWSSIVAGTLDELISSNDFQSEEPKVQAKMVSYLYEYAGEMTKAEMFEGYEPNTRDEAVAAFAEIDLGLSDFLIAYGKYNEIYNMDIRNGEKAVRFSHWVDKQNYSSEQAETVKNELVYYNMAPASAGKYERMVEAGANSERAFDLMDEVYELQKAKAEDVEYWRACVKRSDNEYAQLSLLAGFMDETTYKKVKRAYDLDVSPDMFVTYYETKSKYDADGNGNYTNAEVKEVIDAIGKGYTNEQKGVLWQMATGSKSTKNNPYSKEAGQKWLDEKAKTKAKE